MCVRIRRRGTRCVVGAASIAVAWAVGASAATALDEGIEIRTAANTESKESQQRIDTLSDETDRLLGTYKQVLSQLDALRVYNRQVDELIAAQTTEMSSLEQQIAEVSLVGRQITPHMLEMIEALGAFVALDVPFLAEERNNRIANLRELMGRADVANAEKYRRILEAYQIENEYGRTIEPYQGTLQENGQAKTVDFLRVGRIALVYQSLDGNELGVWDQENRRWLKLDDSYRTPIREGLAIARKQTAPRLIRLPLPAPEDAR